MVEPINIQLNILQGQNVPQQAQELKNVEVHQLLGQRMDQEKKAEEAPKQVQSKNETQDARLNKDGSGRGRGFLRQRRRQTEEPAEEAESRPAEPLKGTKVDTLR